jgi:L-galactono-1,4-lactone dehydrogenase
MDLSEKTTCVNRDSIGTGHLQTLRAHRHVRYMWIPHTDTVVTVCSNPVPAPAAPNPSSLRAVVPSVGSAISSYFSQGPERPTQQMCDLLQKRRGDIQLKAGAGLASSGGGSEGGAIRAGTGVGAGAGAEAVSRAALKDISVAAEKMSVADLRSELLSLGPLDLGHVQAVNSAEAAYWRAAQGRRSGSSTEILGFDCGGEQLVHEVGVHPSISIIYYILCSYLYLYLYLL